MNPIHGKKTHFNNNKILRPVKQLQNSRHSSFVLRVTESGVLTKAQYESFRRTIIKDLRGEVRIWFPPISCLPITRKTSGHRMGKGVGSFDKLVFPIGKSSILLEVTCLQRVSPRILRIFGIAVKKFPVKAKVFYSRTKNLSLTKSK
jgi:ribosomal protein L16/L10AE